MTQAGWRQAQPGRGLASTLVACLIILGLLNIPVECAVASGPHSMFLSPSTVAALQHEAGHATSATDLDAHGRAVHASHTARQADESPALPHAATAGMEHPASDDTLPTPVGFASNAVPLRLTIGPQEGPRPGGASLPNSTYVAEPHGNRQAEPEPPPPNLA